MLELLNNEFTNINFIEVSSVPNSANIAELLCEDHTTTRKLLNIFGTNKIIFVDVTNNMLYNDTFTVKFQYHS